MKIIAKPASNRRKTAVDSVRPPRSRKSIIAIGFVVLISLIGTAAVVAGTMSYQIQPGDTLSELAEDHDTDVETLAELNAIEDPDLIISGEELLIPVDDPETEPETYTVTPGDTLASIAQDFGVTPEEIAEWNGIENLDLIVTGDQLAVPVSYEATSDQFQQEQVEDSDDASAEFAGEQDDSETSDQEPTENAAPILPDAANLHLVGANETLDDLASEYDVTVAQILAANAITVDEFRAGMILKMPPSGMSGVQLVGMPERAETWPVQSELAAVSLATSYWGETVAASDLLAQLESSHNPHLGFRGDPEGMWGTTEDYGVYSAPLAEALSQFGFVGEAFYADGDADALRSRIDAGSPVVVWTTYQFRMQEREVIEDELGRYSLIPEQHSLVVYGYDDEGVYAVDLATGESIYESWSVFMEAWSLFDGMGLAVTLPDES